MQDQSEKRSKEAPTESDKSGSKPEFRNSVPQLPRAKHVITTEMVRQIQQELDDEEVTRANALATGKRL
jgi:hypothetical protein